MSLGVYRLDDYTTATNSEGEQALLDGFAGLLEDGGSTVTVVSKIQRVKYAKNFWNVAFSSIGALTRHSPAAIISLPPPAAASSGCLWRIWCPSTTTSGSRWLWTSPSSASQRAFGLWMETFIFG